MLESYQEKFYNPFIDAFTLDAWLLASRSIVVLDTRFDTTNGDANALKLADRLPGAVHVDINLEAASKAGPKTGRLPLPSIKQLQIDVSRWGINTDSVVVVYDEGHGAQAARLWWVLRWAGVRCVHILDGGYKAWRAAGLPTTREAGLSKRGSVRLIAGGLVEIDATQVVTWPQAGQLLDARTYEAYTGQAGQTTTGHIPGASSLPVASLQTPEGRLKSAESLRHQLDELGINLNRPIATYCGSGGGAAYNVAALHSLGVEAALYAGSWSEWIKDPSRPTCQGDEQARNARQFMPIEF